MVEELRRRLEFDNTSVSVHAVNGVYSQIIEKKKNLKIDKISSSTVEIAELKLLWDKCMDSNQVVGMACSEALLCLVQSGHAEYNYVINTVLNLIPSAKCLTSGLRLLSDLLLLQVTITLKQTKVKGYTCPFQLRTPPHPFISVLTSRPDSWPALLDQVQYLLQQDDDKLGVCCVILLRPFLKYVMLNPSPETSDRSFKTLLYSALLQLCAHQSSDTDETVIYIIDFLVTITPLMQTQPLSVVTETVACLHSLVNFIIRHPDKLKTQLAAAAVNLLCVCKALLRTSGDLKSSLVLLVRISTVATLPTVAVMVLSDLLLNVPVIYFQDVLTVAKKTLSKSTSSCVHTVLVLPVLQAISTSQASVVMTTKQKTLVQSSAWDVLSLIEQCLKSDPHTEEIEMNVNITDPWFSKMSNLTKYVGKFQRYPEAVYDWLNAIQSELKKGDSIPDDVILLLAYLLVTSEQVLLDQCLTVISDVASKDVTKAPYFLSLLLYKLGRENDPELKIKLLYTIPSTGTHKACVGSILKTLQAFAAVPLMEAVAIRLMASLWKLQDRCFPYLQKLLTLVKTPGKSGTHGCDDKLVAKAATIRDVCRERPYQHVSEMLTAIHWFISEFTSPADGTVVVLALEGLYFLCKSEVVDIRTTWGAISSKFTTEDRPLVNSRICELFSLVPDLNVDTEDYEEFRDEVVTLLWCFAKNSHPMISGAAYSALSQFDEEEFRLDDLPENISSEVKAKVRAVRERERERRQITAEEEQEDEEEEDFDIPGDCYTKLICQVNPTILKDFQKFLTSLVAQEMNVMPRGVYQSALKGHKKSSLQSKVVSGVPTLIQRQYDKNKLPGLKQGLAAALLFCYDPSLEVGKDGKPARRHLVGFGRTYQKTLTILLNEVPVQPSEWYRTLLMPQVWTIFMSKLFNAMLEGRKAELEMQLSNKSRELSEYEVENRQKSAWLWVRDTVMDVLKSASRGNPSMQSNSVMALAGLAVTVTKYASSLDKSESDELVKIAPAHLTHAHWLNMVIETLRSIMDNNHVPSGRIFNMCQQRTGGRNTGSSSTLARAAASIALPQLAPMLIATDSDKIFQMLKTLTAMLPGQPSADESPVIQFHSGLGLGSLLSRLYQEHFSEVTGNEGAMATMKALDVLEHSCLTPAIQNTNGCMLGLGLALSSLCGLGATHSRVHVTSTHAKLMALLEVWEDEEKSGISVQTLCMCLACVTVSACNSNYLSAEVGTLVLRKFQSLSQQYPQVPGIATSAGLLCNGLCASGHAGSSDIMDELFQDWMKGVTSVEITPLDQMAMIHGLAALVSMETSFIHLNTDVMMTSEIQSKQNQTVKTLSQIVTSSDDVGLRSNSSWLIAYLYMRSTVGTQTKANVPSSYTYLPDSSVLRAIVDFLITAGKEGPESFSSEEVDVAMTALVNVSKSALPPVNWTAILSPLLRMKFDSEVQLKCIQLAVNQCKSASSASVLIQSWISTSLFATLHDPSKLCLYSSLHILLQGVPMSKVKPFLESSLVEPFTVATLDNSALCRSVLTGLLQALQLADPPQSATLLLYKCVEKIYYLMPNAIQKWQTPLLSSLSDCLCLLPSEVLDRLTNPSEQGNLLKATYIRCYLFSQGKQPIAWLNSCIDVAMATSRRSTHQTVVWWFASSFHQCTTVQRELAGTIQRMDWLLELLGHMKNIAYKKETVSQEHLPTALKFLLDIFAVAVVTWSARNAHLSLGLVSFQSSVSGSHEEVSNTVAMLSPHRSLNFQDIFSEGENVENFAISGMRSLLPNCLQVLLSKQPWNQHIDKVLDWLIVMLDTQQSVLTETCRHTLKDTLCALRHLTGFRKPSHWTRAFNSDN